MNTDILEYVDLVRLNRSRNMNLDKSKLEQYFSPKPVAQFMASLFQFNNEHIRILDPGAGVGSLFAACVEEIIRNRKNVKQISVTTYEIDGLLTSYLNDVFRKCKEICEKVGISFTGETIQTDFINHSADNFVLDSPNKYYNCVILNPPYGKIKIKSSVYRILKNLDVPSTNYYSAFMLIAEKFLERNGEMVSITPRSFCNGVYFKQFRKQFLTNMKIRRIHLYTSRKLSFKDDNVLQENVILHCVKSKTSQPITISSSDGLNYDITTIRRVDEDKVILPSDNEKFVRILVNDLAEKAAADLHKLKSRISDLNLEVSTGKVVDFRYRQFLDYHSSGKTVPLIHPANISKGCLVKWPIEGLKKPANIKLTKETSSILIPAGNYVLTKRFSTNEERKRIVAAFYKKDQNNFPMLGFENRINYFHNKSSGLQMEVAKGLTLYLNSTVVDTYFRHFNGHTQVNAADLRNIPYPTLVQLKKLGTYVSDKFPDQNSLDDIVNKELFECPKIMSK